MLCFKKYKYSFYLLLLLFKIKQRQIRCSAHRLSDHSTWVMGIGNNNGLRTPTPDTILKS